MRKNNLKRIKKLFEEIQNMKEEESIVKIYDTLRDYCQGCPYMELGSCKIGEDELAKMFEDELVCKGKVPSKFMRTFKMLVKARRISKAESSPSLRLRMSKRSRTSS
jgi:5'-deoxynucleotidase YfbR-like HD superfamily hydrolase